MAAGKHSEISPFLRVIFPTTLRGPNLNWMCHALDHPFKRAAFMLFLISEVHPFIDGNGRVARVMMNAELVAGDRPEY
jgi:hypothetical protein